MMRTSAVNLELATSDGLERALHATPDKVEAPEVRRHHLNARAHRCTFYVGFRVMSRGDPDIPHDLWLEWG